MGSGAAIRTLAPGRSPGHSTGSIQHGRAHTFPSSSPSPHPKTQPSSVGTHPAPTPSSYPGSFCSSWLMKSLACWEMSEKVSSSNSHWAAVTLLSVSMSVSPWKGDSPLSLERGQRLSAATQPLPDQLPSPRSHSQDVTDDTDAPHVCGKPHGLEGDHFWSHELRGPMQHLHGGVWSCREGGAVGQCLARTSPGHPNTRRYLGVSGASPGTATRAHLGAGHPWVQGSPGCPPHGFPCSTRSSAGTPLTHPASVPGRSRRS